ncbi:oligoendopeptidase F [Ideonella sp. BN130291]|uniref:oligoendopeptidase F n=1 Tax=Ideonella sp. BN130291 TaxID=3112940 RepID=UPI002E268022|nr:oligoendopeptidase F [Ideonella sp. BN130291]
MRLCLTAALLAVTIGLSPATQAAESEADRWNLADIYPAQAAWDADAAKLESQFKAFGACKGQLGRSAARLRECLDLNADMTKRLYRLYVYAAERLAEDTGVSASLALQQRVDLLQNRLSETVAFMEPEILRIGAPKVKQFLAQDKGLGVHRFGLERTLRTAAHTLSAEGEGIIAAFGLMNDSGQAAYNILSNADIPWPKLKLASGEEVTLDASAYTKYREAPNREDRKRVMDAFFGTFKTYERTMGVTLYAQLKQDKVYAAVRKYPDSITRSLDQENLPVAVIDTLIAQTNANLPTLHRYFKLRAKLLGVSDMRYYDIYPPLVRGENFKFPLAAAKQFTLEAVAPLGTEYVEAMRKGFDSRWMDAYPRPRKLSGAHMAGYAYDLHPFVLMNYNDDYESVTTLAHEWGHAMHSYLASRAQPFVTANYATFTAEIASTFNEALLLDRMLRAAKTDDERLFYLGSALEGLRGTFFRQAMFAEFERTIHAQADRGEPLTGEALTKTYCDILKRYHGADQGVVAIDEAYCTEWAYIPHFYNAFYVYQYATSIAASQQFAKAVAGGDKAALERYLGLLKAGGSGYPYDLVKRAGVDLATPAPYQALVARMNQIMDDIEAILAKRR